MIQSIKIKNSLVSSTPAVPEKQQLIFTAEPLIFLKAVINLSKEATLGDVGAEVVLKWEFVSHLGDTLLL